MSALNVQPRSASVDENNSHHRDAGVATVPALELAAGLQKIAEPKRSVLDVRALRIELASGDDVVADISFSVTPGEIIGLVGESGSGKTTIATALLGHARSGARIVGGEIRVDGNDVLSLRGEALRRLRGTTVSYVAQDPAVSLNPLLRIRTHLDEILKTHAGHLNRAERDARSLAVLTDVGLPADAEFLLRFPHQLSGGQQQRVQLALAFVLRPKLIVLDEPTTALDVTTQARVLETIRTLCRNYGVAAVYVSHDLAVVRALVDRVVVLYAGRIVEAAALKTLFEQPTHPYSQGLLAAVPDVAERRLLQPIPGQAPAPGTRPAGCAFAQRCPLASDICRANSPPLASIGNVHGDDSQAIDSHKAACWHHDRGPAFKQLANLPSQPATDDGTALLAVDNLNARYGSRQILFDISLRIAAGSCVALVGESGSGKTTLARTLAGLPIDANASLQYHGATIPLPSHARDALVRRQIQYIFQNPYRALNPRHTVGEILVTALRHFFPLDRHAARERAAAVLQRVSLQPRLLDVYPRELSGGERQRVAIARALVCEPRLLICDEITSALDVSVQAAILALLRDLQKDGLALLFVTHDLGVVRAVADQVAVLHHGRIVEYGATDTVLDHPAADYTRALVQDSPSLQQPLQRANANAL